MSRKLLNELNGGRNGAFSKWLDKLNREPRIAWYPSAGHDFRDILHLNGNYSKFSPSPVPETRPPDLYLHTDYAPWGYPTFLKKKIMYDDGRTFVLRKSVEVLPRCDLPVDQRLVVFEAGDVTGCALFMEIELYSHKLGKVSAPLLYVFAENGAFCSDKILPNGGKISHLIHRNWGTGMGGGRSPGAWVLNILQRIQCRCFITDHRGLVVNRGLVGLRYEVDNEWNDETVNVYPRLGPVEQEKPQQLRTLRIIRDAWGSIGDIYWNQIPQRPPYLRDRPRHRRAESVQG